ncbi:reprolysin-like metallopeptidase [Arthrobacter sp. zg-Y1143]|uniref:reprolysin-like metallopeptidase n=1 Tax=Arthrobacter sp. zg-Y1143 TaxID=3049065 RepID=UPI0024C32A07|nr:hypothetical protein [Arthrobacter sp. zg-Y1143]MDK1328036.1 hypothetical protein [Arthrobacter sp. zg-Y1143]
MKSAKLAMLAVLAATLTAGSLPAQGPFEVPQPAPTGVAGTGEAPVTDPVPSPVPSEGTGPTTGATSPAADSVPTATATAAATDPVTVPAETEDPEADGGYDPVVGGGFPVPGPNTPLITDPDGSVRPAVESDIASAVDSAAHDHGAARSLSSPTGGASTMGAAARSATIQVTVVYATLTDNRGGIDREAANASVSVANSYWRAMSDGRLGMSISGTRSINSSASSWQDYSDMMNTIKGDLGWRDSANTALLVFVPAGELRSGGYGGILGGGWTAGPTSGSVIMPAPSRFTNNVVAHEFGHVLGLLHANGLQCSNGRSDVTGNGAGSWSDPACTSREYADTLDLMGSAQYYHPVINSFFWDKGGFGRGNEILNAGTADSSPHSYTLTPWGGSAANRAVKFTDPGSGDVYYLELRQPAGYDEHLQWDSAGNRGVKIVKADAANSWALNSLIITPSTRPFAGYYNSNMAWQSGQTFTTSSGTTVKIDYVNASSASVTIKAKSGDLYFNSSPVSGTSLGNPADRFLTCDWDGDGVATPAAFRNGQWTLRTSLTGNSSQPVFAFGDTGDQPICGDWDGDGRDSVGVFRNGTVFLKNSNSNGAPDGQIYFGDRGDTAVVGDWDGDGCDTLGVARPDSGAKRFFLTNSNIRPDVNGAFHLGNGNDIPVAGDWNQDGYSTIGVKRQNMWYLSNSNLRVAADWNVLFGDPGDSPMTGRWTRGVGTGLGVVR